MNEDKAVAETALAGRVVALPESRELDRLAQLLESSGARAWRCPLVTILDVPDPTPIESWLRVVAAGGMDDVIFLTGEGVRRLMSVAERVGLTADVVAALGRMRKITRGPKPARVLKELGLSTDIPAAVPTSVGVMHELTKMDLRGRRVGVQLYGEEPSVELRTCLTTAGAEVHVVAPYVYAPRTDATKVVELIDAMAAGTVDAIAFTSASQIDRLFHVADEAGRAATLAQAWTRVRVAVIGPVAAESLRRHGIEPAIIPDKAFVMRNLVSAMAAAFERK
jgi:uroporphyrinogen-III synthase